MRNCMTHALEHKIKKAKNNNDYHGAWLGIVLQNIIPFDVGSELDPICSEMIETYKYKHPFTRIFFVSGMHPYLFDSRDIELI